MNNKVNIKALVAFSILLSLLFFFYNMYKQQIFFYAGMLMLAGSLIAFSPKESFLVIAFLTPNLFMFKYLGKDSAILGYYFAALGLKQFLKNFLRNQKISLWGLMHFGSVLITCFYNSDLFLGISLVRFCCNFFYFCYCATLFQRGHEIKQVMKMYFAGTIIAIAMGMVYRSFNGALFNGYFAGINCGRNYFGAVVAPSITILIVYYVERKNTLSESVLYGATLGICMVSIILSNSRTTTLSMIIPVALFLFYSTQTIVRNSRIKKIIPLGMLILVIAAVVCIYYSDSLAALLRRFKNDDMSTGNGRFVLWKYYTLQTCHTLGSFLFGCGSNFRSDYFEVEHSTIVQCFHQLGLLGIISYTGIMKYTFRKITQGKKPSLVSFFPLLSVVVPYCGINGLYSDHVSVLLVLCAMIMYDLSKTGIPRRAY